ncbi:MAG TPA: protease modulator HflC, partial [Sedimentisphaerales bacterium]|nr:protease modulator HflC [Sedimentisphaerales bacterium]
MKNIAIPILIAVISLVMIVYLVTFQVRETESGFVTRFGKPVREVTKPGLYFKWPTPIEQIHKFDSRMRVLEAAQLAETTTRGNVPIIVNTYIVWRVAEPLKFLNAVKTEANAESKLRNHINDTQNRVIGQHSFGEFVNNDPSKIQFDKIQEEMLDDLKGPVRAEYGIEIKTLGIKQLKVSEDVTKKVFERMKAERQGRTDAITSEGEAIATQIRADANKKRDILLDAAEGRAKEIRGQGDADAARYYEMLKADEKLAIFLRNLEALKQILRERTTIVIPTVAEPFSLLMGIPPLGTEG